jgi:putative tryptophan/tyrosine transport system substrate-binding protein
MEQGAKNLNASEKPMRKKFFGFSLCPLLFALCVSVEAQQTVGKVVRIGYLGNAKPPSDLRREEAFFQGLREYGWIEGQNIVVERRYWENRAERLPELVNEFVHFKADIIVTSSGSAAAAAKKATNAIPIVMLTSGDAVTQGLVASLARPGGNVTGLTNISPDTNRKRLELLKEVVPKASRVAVLGCSRGSALNTAQWDETQAAARALGLQLQPAEVSGGPQEIEHALSTATRKRAAALFVHDCSLIPSSKTVEFAAKFRLPAIYPSIRYMDAGGLMMYGPNAVDLARRAATYVDKILKGTKPADLPVEQPTKFELVINLKTAKQIGLTIPQWTLTKADRVIK